MITQCSTDLTEEYRQGDGLISRSARPNLLYARLGLDYYKPATLPRYWN